MWANLQNYYLNRIFTFTGVLDWLIFIISLAVIFFDRQLLEKNKLNLKNALILIAEIIGMYAVLLVCGGVIRLICSVDIIVNYLPKLVLTVLYILFFNNYKWQSKIILGALIFALNNCFIEVSGCFSGVLDANGSSGVTVYIRSFITVLTLAAAVLLRKYNIDKFRNIQVSAVVEVAIFSSMGVMLAVLRSLFIPYFSSFEQTEYYKYSFYSHLYIMIILICIIVFIFVCYFFLVRNIKVNQDNIELANKLIRLENVEEMVAVNESNLRQLYKVKHEIKNRFSIMKEMLKDKKYNELEKYFKEINDESVVSFARVSTGNECFDRIFNLEISKAVDKKIEVITKLIVPPEINVSEADLSGLITNLMDNAIEACEKIENAPRFIDISVQVVHSYLILKITNAVSEENAKTALLLITDKPNKNLHGFGTEIINDIVKKYDGQILRRVENNTFIADIMLDIK